MNDMQAKKVLLAPLDPVHDVGLKLIRRKLQEKGHIAVLLPPDLTVEEIVSRALQEKPDVLMVSRALSYGTAELMAKFVDLCDGSGLRQNCLLAAGGLSMRPELAQELGFDAGFGPDSTPEDALAFVEGRERNQVAGRINREKVDLTRGYTYEFRDSEIGELCDELARGLIKWASVRTSPGIERAELRLAIEQARGNGNHREAKELLEKYKSLCDGAVRAFYETGEPVAHTRQVSKKEEREIGFLDDILEHEAVPKSQEILFGKNVFVQYGTGCPEMDAYHASLSLSWGARGVIHFDPSWGARTEGLLEGKWSHEHDGTVLTLDNLLLIKRGIAPGAMWQVRAHRGLNTPETVVLAHLAGADLTKINIVYGSLGAGTDPERLACDGVEAMKLAARFGLPYDVVTNEELCGVSAAKAFAGMLVVARAGVLLGGKPILQPLFANSPEAIIMGFTEDNYIDFNAAKMMALRSIVHMPIWPGAPVGFLTQSQDRCQSATMTALHAALALKLGAVACTIASSDEAYAGGPITAQARVDTLKATAAALRFMGNSSFEPTSAASRMAEKLRDDILAVLREARKTGDFVKSLYAGVFGSKEDGAYPGRAGRGTVRVRQ